MFTYNDDMWNNVGSNFPRNNKSAENNRCLKVRKNYLWTAKVAFRYRPSTVLP